MDVQFFVSKVKAILAAQSSSITQMSKDIGLARQNFYYWEQGGRVPSAESIAKIAEYLDVAPEELTDPNFKYSVKPHFDEEAIPEGYVAIPEYELKFSAGNAGMEPEWEEVQSSQPMLYKHTFFAKLGVSYTKCIRARVRGDSMEPELHDGDRIMFIRESDPHPSEVPIIDGDIYAISIDNAYRVKRLARVKDGIRVSSFNEDQYPPEVFTGEEVDRLRIYGRVVESTRCY